MVFAVIGLGYVGLPVLEALHEAGESVLGFDISGPRIEEIETQFSLKQRAEIMLTSNPEELRGLSAYIVCVPTPLAEDGTPDTSSLSQTARLIMDSIVIGEKAPLVVVESSVAPGMTRKLFLERFEKSGLILDRHYLLGHSPERIDPGNNTWNLSNTPKLVAGASTKSLIETRDLYNLICDDVVEAQTLEAAETAKLFENTFRQVNLALVNELSMALDDAYMVSHVLGLASTKPFGFMAFKPGAGVGGHCIPVDPIYLNHGLHALSGKRLSVVDLAHEINAKVPIFHADKVISLISEEKPVEGHTATVLIAGVGYKEGSKDLRETPAVAIVSRLRESGLEISYFDPNVESFVVDGEPVKRVKDINSSCDLLMLLHSERSLGVKVREIGSRILYRAGPNLERRTVEQSLAKG